MTNRKPVIGVTPCSRVDDYLESVKRAGAEPVLLSNDDDPALYGEAPHPTTEAAPERDRFEIPLSREAVKRDVPLFAICRGVQVLNVAEGGTLVQDIPSSVESELNHSIDLPKNEIAHDVAITPDTRLAAAL